MVDDHALVRETLSERLGREEAFEVVGAASTADEGIRLARDHRPDVILMDIEMPGMVSFDAAREILTAQPDVRIIFLSAYLHDRYIEDALKVGALGYLTKADPPERVVEAIHEVAANRAFFSEGVRDRIVFEANRPKLVGKGYSRASTLTPRELEVLRYVARGLSKKEIAGLLHVTVKTVEKHSDNLMRKLDIHDRVELARFAIREGLA
ncbi:MAG: response regulator, partial [Planctomycetota bacterium]